MTRAQTDAQTLADRFRYLEAGLVEVACTACPAKVRVKKASPQQTSVQWSRPAVGACAEFAARTGDGVPNALVPGCAHLRDSIDQAVRDGRLEVS